MHFRLHVPVSLMIIIIIMIHVYIFIETEFVKGLDNKIYRKPETKTKKQNRMHFTDTTTSSVMVDKTYDYLWCKNKCKMLVIQCCPAARHPSTVLRLCPWCWNQRRPLSAEQRTHGYVVLHSSLLFLMPFVTFYLRYCYSCAPTQPPNHSPHLILYFHAARSDISRECGLWSPDEELGNYDLSSASMWRPSSEDGHITYTHWL